MAKRSKRRARAARDVRDTRAKVALAEWFAADSRRTQALLAARLGRSQPLVSQWLAGVTRPGPVERAALEAICGIPAVDWLDAHERAEIELMRTAV